MPNSRTPPPKLVVSYLEEREKDPNHRKYPYKTDFTVNMLDTRDVDRMFDSPEVLRSWLGFELGITIEPDGIFYKNKTTNIERFTGRDMELLVQLADENTPVNDHVLLKGKYHTLLFQKEESEITPFTCVTGGVEEIESYIRNLVEQGKILAYEIWSGAGENKIVKSFKVERNKKVSGIPNYVQEIVNKHLEFRKQEVAAPEPRKATTSFKY